MEADQEFNFIKLCENGNIDEIIAFYNNNTTGDVFPEAFRIACETNNLPLIDWLYSVKPTIVSLECETTFYYACQNGNLDKVKCIFSLNHNITKDIDYDYAFFTASKSGQYEIVHWLASVVKLTPFMNE